MILGRNLLTGLLVHSSGAAICHHCWNGKHEKCTGRADEFNKCECDTWPPTKQKHAIDRTAKTL